MVPCFQPPGFFPKEIAQPERQAHIQSLTWFRFLWRSENVAWNPVFGPAGSTTVDSYERHGWKWIFFGFLGGFCRYSLFTIVSGRNPSGKKQVLTIHVAKVLKTKRHESEIIFWKFIRQSRVPVTFANFDLRRLQGVTVSMFFLFLGKSSDLS